MIKSTMQTTYASEWFGIQTKPIGLVSVFGCEPNRTDCQEIKSLIFRFGSVSFGSQSVETET
jgi:hypothetical protein